MTDRSERKRKRSRVAGFTAVGVLGMLASACSSEPTDDELSASLFGPPQEVRAFQSVSECAASGDFAQEDCVQGEKDAWDQNENDAPRFAELPDCEDQFGNGQCVQRTNSGTSFWTPVMAGFLMGQLIDIDLKKKKKYKALGLYKDRREDRYYTGSGGYLYGGSGTRYKIGSKALDTVKSPRVQTASDVRSRGGFGSRARSSGGGWGRGG